MTPGRTTTRIELTDAERTALSNLSKHRGGKRLAFRARIILCCERLIYDSAVAKRLRINSSVVRKWRHRYLSGGIAALSDAPKPGPPRKLGEDRLREVIKFMQEKTPDGNYCWDLQGLAKRFKVSERTIRRFWKKYGIEVAD